MDAPKPIKCETPKNEEIKMKDIRIFDIQLNNEKYKLELVKCENNENIILRISKNNDSIIIKYYCISLNINDFHHLHIFFKIYQTIEEIYNIVLEMIINKKYIIISKNNSIIMQFQFTMPGSKNVNIDF